MEVGTLPIVVVALIGLSEVVLSLRLRHLAALSVEELNGRQPELQTVGFAARSLPTVIFGLAILVIVARVGRRLTIDEAVAMMLGLLMLWMLASAIIELNFGLTYRLVRRRRLPGEGPLKPEQYRLGPDVKRNGLYRLAIWLICAVLMVIALVS